MKKKGRVEATKKNENSVKKKQKEKKQKAKKEMIKTRRRDNLTLYMEIIKR